ncbi:hypothetical protein PoB_006925100 [Plakobranchus ocellatus]|uniref:Uncharacterized protein n=1 Tax=Plakobranchus ocellatus TaxID=259542 RepID=A0AAV4DF14_9GAST|nr:hypothetical protein PoB_006925100 [Plakobranchus ocellatus]
MDPLSERVHLPFCRSQVKSSSDHSLFTDDPALHLATTALCQQVTLPGSIISLASPAFLPLTPWPGFTIRASSVSIVHPILWPGFTHMARLPSIIPALAWVHYQG